MKKLLILLIITIISSNFSTIRSQSKNGAFKSYYENGKVKSDETYKNGRKIGICKYYYENGKLQYEESYNDNGIARGIFNSYYNGGQLESSYTYQDGQKHGVFKEYYEDGKLREDGKYEYGKRIYYPKGDNGLSSNESNNNASINREDGSVKYENTETLAQFQGGNKALMKFINENLRYPVNAAEKGIEGRVTVSFIVNSNGDIVNPQVSKGVDPALDQEAIRIMKSMPKWVPANKNGVNVLSVFTMPILFKLSANSNRTTSNTTTSSTTKDIKITDSETAYYIFGTTKELSEVLNGNIKESSLVKININKVRRISPYSKMAKVLSKHPIDSYRLQKEDDGYLALRILDPVSFWSMTKLLIIEVP